MSGSASSVSAHGNDKAWTSERRQGGTRDPVLPLAIEARVRRLIDDLQADDLTLALLDFAQLYRALAKHNWLETTRSDRPRQPNGAFAGSGDPSPGGAAWSRGVA